MNSNITLPCILKNYLEMTTLLELFMHLVLRKKKVVDDYYVFHEFLFKKSKLYIPKCYIRDFFFSEAHVGTLMRHFGINKTYNMLYKRPKMKHDVHNFCNQFFKCKEAKTRSQPNGLYTKGLPTNISINFVISLGTLKMVRDSIFIVRVK